MRNFWAVMVLLFGAASADATETQKLDAAQPPPETWCSDGFDKPTELVITAGENFVLKIDGSPDETLDKVEDTIFPASLLRHLKKGSPPKEYPVWIVRDRVFWPCDG